MHAMNHTQAISNAMMLEKFSEFSITDIWKALPPGRTPLTVEFFMIKTIFCFHPGMNAKSYELRQISEIEKWMNRKPDAVSQFADGILSPFTAVVSRLVPQAAIMGALDLGKWLLSNGLIQRPIYRLEAPEEIIEAEIISN